MARLGEHLVAARLLDQEQIERALRAQVLWGARLGTNLIELGYLDLDGISRALGRQHGLPAALARHFDKADRELQERLPAALALEWSVVPLLHVGPEKNIAIAVLDPLPGEALAALADAFLCAPETLVVSVAAEMRVRYHLERVYGVPRAKRFLRTKGKSVTPFPQFDNIPVPVDSDADVAVPIAVDDSAHPTGRSTAAQSALRDEPAPEPSAGLAAIDAAIAAAEPEAGPPANAPRGRVETADAAAPVIVPRGRVETVDDIEKLIDEAVALVTAHEPTAPAGRDRRTYVRTLADEMPPPPAASTPVGPARSANDSIAMAPTGVWTPVEDDGAPLATAIPRATSTPSPPRASQTDLPSPASVVAAPMPTAPTARVPVPAGAQLGRIAVKRVPAHEIDQPPTSFIDAARAIRRATHRDRVADLIVYTLDKFVPACEAALLLVIRGDVAISWKHFSRTCNTFADIAVPLEPPGLVPTVAERNTTARAGVAELGAIDEALLRSLHELRGDLVVVPIAIADQVMCLIATATAADAPVEGVESVAAAAAAAFARLIRDASR